MVFKRENPNPADFNQEADDILHEQLRIEEEEGKIAPRKDSIVTDEMIKDAKLKERSEIEETEGHDSHAEHMHFGCGCGEQYRRKN